MTKVINRAASFCMALLIAMSFVPLLGAQEAYAEAVDAGAVIIDLDSGRDALMSERMHAVRNVLKSLANRGYINGDESSYDLDKDGSTDMTFETDPKSYYNPEQDWYTLSSTTTSIEGETWSIDVPFLVKSSLRRRGMEYCSRIEIKFPKLIRELNYEIKAPVCGTETTTPKNKYGNWAFDGQTNRPEVQETDYNEFYYLNVIDAYWVSENGENDPYVGVLKGGEDYPVEIDIVAAEGYHIADDAKVNIDGFEMKGMEINVLYTRITGTVRVSEDSHIAGAPEITPPAFDKEGSKAFRCKGCGKVLKTEAISNDTIREEYARGEAAGRAAAEKEAADMIREEYARGEAAGRAAAERAAKLTPGKAVIKKVKTGCKKAKITWKTVKKATAYELRITGTKTGKVKTVTVKQTKKKAAKKTISRTVKKLKKGKYKVKVRAVREIGGETFCGTWSGAKTVRIK